jgi:hypothetical protein
MPAPHKPRSSLKRRPSLKTRPSRTTRHLDRSIAASGVPGERSLFPGCPIHDGFIVMGGTYNATPSLRSAQ